MVRGRNVDRPRGTLTVTSLVKTCPFIYGTRMGGRVCCHHLLQRERVCGLPPEPPYCPWVDETRCLTYPCPDRPGPVQFLGRRMIL